MDSPKGGKNIRKRRSSLNGNPPAKKRTKPEKKPLETIAKSKQLLNKLSQRTRINKRESKNDGVRLCGNGQLMPALIELEHMFADSDDDESKGLPSTPERCKTPVSSTPTFPKEKLLSPIQPERCKTPVSPIPAIPEEKLLSPTTIKLIADKLLNKFNNLEDASILLDDEHPGPVIPIKRPKKSGIPYIVGCKDRCKVIKKPVVKFCKGDKDYGVTNETNGFNDEEENSPSKKRHRCGPALNMSKSIFNAQSDEIAARLKQFNDGEEEQTVGTMVKYQPLSNPAPSIKPLSFSPIPSTSKDNETITKNEELFNESISSLSKNIRQDEIINIPTSKISENECLNGTITSEILEIIDIPSPKIIEVRAQKNNVDGTNNEEIIKDPWETITIDDEMSNSCVEIKDMDSNIPETINIDSQIDDSPVCIDGYYSSINIDDNNSDTCEIIDIDALIAENQEFLEKRKSKITDTVTYVPLNIIPSSSIKNNESDKNTTATYNEKKSISEVVTNFFENKGSTSYKDPPEIIELESKSPKKNSWMEMLKLWMSSLLNANKSGSNNQSKITDYCPINETNVTSRNDNLNTNTDIIQIDETLQSPQSPPATHFPSINLHYQQYPLRNQASTQKKTRNKKLASPAQLYGTSTNQPTNGWYQLSPRNKATKAKTSKKNKQENPPQPQNIIESNPSTLGTSLVGQNNKTSRSYDCPICLESLANTAAASTVCGHIFCMECIKTHLKGRVNKNCPTCRKVLRGVGYHQLFL